MINNFFTLVQPSRFSVIFDVKMMPLETLRYPDVHQHLVDRCRTGDRKAQYELYKRYSKAMFNVSMRITNDYAEAEDVLQDSFLSAFQNIHTFRGDSTFGNWLKMIVINNALGVVRKRKLELVGIDDRDYAEVYDDWDEADMVCQVAHVRDVIQQLPDGYRIVLSLYLLEGYDHKEIGEILRITEATSKSQYSRAKKKLLDMLRNQNGRLKIED